MKSQRPTPGVRHILRQKLTTLRADLGLSQMELARRADVSRPIVSALEQGRGNPSLAVLERLAEAVDCSVIELLTLTRSAGSDTDPSKGLHPRANDGRYSRSGRKPSFRSWLQNPPAVSKTAEAQRFGVDLSLLAQTLELSPSKRLRNMTKGAATLRLLRQAKSVR